MLDRLAAQRLRRASSRLDHWTAERNRLIVEAHKAGASLREIAEHADLSHVAVLKIIRKEAPPTKRE